MTRFLHYVLFVLHTKGIIGAVLRIGMIIARFDFRGKKMNDVVSSINQLGIKYNFKPAMIVPAVVLQRHKGLLKYATNSNLEFAIHGHTHKNHRPWSLEKQKTEVVKAKVVFDDLGMPYCGFRAPYLSCNSETDDALEMSGMLWNSDQGIMWNHNNGQLPKHRHYMEKAIQFLYSPADSDKTLAIPRMHGQMVCIPLVFPDDEILIDRFGIKNPDRIAQIWNNILDQTNARGDVFVLQLHPERFCFCQKAMDALLDVIVKSDKCIWVTDMYEIAKWWKERSEFNFIIVEQSEKCFEIQCECSDRATILTKNVPDMTVQFHHGYQQVSKKSFNLTTKGSRPCVGIHPQCPPALHKFLKELGFAHQLSESDSDYSVFFDKHETYSLEEEVSILHRIEQCDQPLLRFWLWPNHYESAFTTSHDLDCITLTDFVYRALGQ